MKKNNTRTTTRTPPSKRGLGRGLDELLADTSSMEALQVRPSATDDGKDAERAAAEANLNDERAQLLKEAEALRILMLEFELLIRAELH
ncbi:MAG: hypothetical protein PHU14_03790 [Methylovulum sp.]|nr:hypothetical protein [Methylovulum sp.]